MNTLASELHVGLIYLGVLGLLFLALTVNVIRHRWKFRVGLGVGNNPMMEQIVRVHANFSEYVPFCSLLLIVLEINHTSPVTLHALWIVLIASRVFHAWGLLSGRGPTKGRTIGMVLTAVVLLGSSLSLFTQYFA
jgi:uncharacterized membrane protein YecN with MAPEG domain